MGYKKQDFDRFVTSIRGHYHGDVFLLITESAPNDIKELLAQHNIQFVTTTEKGGNRFSDAWLRINQVRWDFYQKTCQESSYDLCMAIDSRDSLFQDDPFQQLMGTPNGNLLHLYQHSMMMNDWHLKMAFSCKGTNEAMKGKPIINAGGFIATPAVVPQLARMAQDYGKKCDDQVALNLGVCSNILNNTKVTSHSQGEGSINNIGWGGKYRLDSRRRYLNHNCFPSPAVHQFDAVGAS